MNRLGVRTLGHLVVWLVAALVGAGCQSGIELVDSAPTPAVETDMSETPETPEAPPPVETDSADQAEAAPPDAPESEADVGTDPDPDGSQVPDPDGSQVSDPDGSQMPDPDGSQMPDPAPPTDTPVLLEGFLSFSPDGRYGYDSSLNPWNSPPPCGQTLDEPVVGIDMVRSSAAGDFVTFASGLDHPGVASGLDFHPSGSGVLTMVCGEFPEQQSAAVLVTIAANGQLLAEGNSFEVDPDGSWYHGVRSMPEPHVAEFEFIREDIDEDGNNVSEIRRLDLETGVWTFVTSVDPDVGFHRGFAEWTTPDGRFAYSVIDDPNEQLGCEGFGIAETIAVDDGTGPRAMFGPDHAVWASIDRVQFGADDLVGWTNSCEGYSNFYVGRILDDGTIADVHDVDMNTVDDEFIHFQHLNMTPDGDIVSLGLRWDADGKSEPRFRVFSLRDDPEFLNTGPEQPVVDFDSPIAETLAGTGSWFRGKSVTQSGPCDRDTLYATTTAGLVKGLNSPSELGVLVDAVAGPVLSFEVGFGSETRTIERRTFVFVTECDAEFVGRRVWYAAEPEVPGYGFWLQWADVEGASQVLSVRQEVVDDELGSTELVADVVFENGERAEVVLRPTW